MNFSTIEEPMKKEQEKISLETMNAENARLSAENSALVESLTAVYYQSFSGKRELAEEREHDRCLFQKWQRDQNKTGFQVVEPGSLLNDVRFWFNREDSYVPAYTL